MKRKGKVVQQNKLSSFQRISLFFFDRPRLAAIIWLVIFSFGILSYTTLLKREGFPDVAIPYSYTAGAYLVDDASKVDKDVALPLSKVLVKQENVKMVQSVAGDNFFRVYIEFEEGTDAAQASDKANQAVTAANVLPANVKATFTPLKNAIDEDGNDMLLAFYSNNNSVDTKDLMAKAQTAAAYLKNTGKITLAEDIKAVDVYVSGVSPETGQREVSQNKFDRFGIRPANQDTKFYKSIGIGIKGVKGHDVLELDKQVRSAMDQLNSDVNYRGFTTSVSYSLAPQIEDQITNLQESLLEGLAAVLIISAILIALRASIITVSSMALVLTATLGILYLIGYSLNTITLFSLVLCLSLIVDDTIIMVEAIDAQRRKSKNAREVIQKATKKISRAMLAATFTAMIGFAPLIFVSGILGSFIRAIPVTVIASLLVSLVVALTFIPFLSKYLLLRPSQLGHGDEGDDSPSHHLETFIAKTIARPLMWINHHRKRQFLLGISAVLVGFGFIMAGGFLFSKVTFNIFAPAKDSDGLVVQMAFPANTSIDKAQETADRADAIVNKQLGVNFKQASYFTSGTTSGAQLTVDLTPFSERDAKAPALVKQLEGAFQNFDGAVVKVVTLDVGPPTGAFSVHITTDNREAANKLAKDMQAYLMTAELQRANGTTAHFKSATIANPGLTTRNDGKQYVEVTAEFDGSDTSALVILGETSVKNHFNSQKLASYGLKSENLDFDFGSESDNQDSFKTLLFAFPILLVVIYFLLITQFRSLLQPLLIFMAIPFSLFGITAGLWLTDNAFSFFTMLGFFALIGLSIKNTILLTDYANQARRSGSNAVEAVAISLQERFRPLIATSLTAIVSLIPLYLSNPFWEGLAVTLMFGLLSSTFLVVVVFPYYYLGAEYLRLKVSRKVFGLWLVITVLLSVGLGVAGLGPAAILAVPLTIIVFPFVKKLWWNKRSA